MLETFIEKMLLSETVREYEEVQKEMTELNVWPEFNEKVDGSIKLMLVSFKSVLLKKWKPENIEDIMDKETQLLFIDNLNIRFNPNTLALTANPVLYKNRYCGNGDDTQLA